MGGGLMLPYARQWAERRLAGATVGDKRSDARLCRVASVLAVRPSGVLSKVFKKPADLWGAYRLFQREETTYEAITGCAFLQVREACRAAGEYILIEDGTEVDFSHRPDLPAAGRIGNGRGWGWKVHTTLALRIRGWDAYEPQVRVMGLFN